MVGDTMNASATDKQDMVGADEGEEFIVERIVTHRMRNGRKEYLLAWKGYPEEENTWVSAEQPACLAAKRACRIFCIGTAPESRLSGLDRSVRESHLAKISLCA